MVKIYTKAGDFGKTSLLGKAKVSKSHPKVVAYGAVDMANSAIGMVRSCSDLNSKYNQILESIMSDLFSIGMELASQKDIKNITKLSNMAISLNHTTKIEKIIDEFDDNLPKLKNFILPFGCECSSKMHMARTHIRQAEQSIVKLKDEGFFVRDEILTYINRLSDLFFVWARFVNAEKGIKDKMWNI